MERQLDLTAQSLWREVATRLRQALNETTYQTWFGEARGIELSTTPSPSPLPNDFAKAWIGGHFLELIKAAVREATGKELEINLTVRRRPRLQPAAAAAQRPKPAYTDLNPKYTFDSFVVGSSNRSRTRPPSRSRRRRRRRTTRSSSTAA